MNSLRFPIALLGFMAALCVTCACSSGGDAGNSSTGGSSAGSSGTATTGGSGATATGGATSANGAITAAMPTPPGAGDQPAPSGTSASPNLVVLDWAGFAAAVSYTLDDTQPSQIEHWPELKATGIPMTFYANPSGNWAAGYDATWKEAIALGSEIGNHTMHHCDVTLGQCNNPLATIDDEIDQCTTYIQNTLGQAEVTTMAYPYGDTGYSPYAKTRFFIGRGVNSGMVGARDTTDPFAVPCIAAAGGENASVFSGNIDTARGQHKWLLFLFHSVLPTQNNWYAGVDISAITGSIDHAKQLGDVWTDTVANVGAYWVGQKLLAGATPTQGSTWTWTWTLPGHFPTGHGLRVAVDGGTLSQGGTPLTWDGHGYYEVALDTGSLTWSP